MNRIYIYDGPFGKGRDGDGLIKRAAQYYVKETEGESAAFSSEIIRPENGKPYFKDGGPEFSVSHSEGLWMCIMSDIPCGIDVQVVKDCDCEKMAARFFSEREKHYVDLWGQWGFFNIWVRYEAFAKCRGEGFFSEKPEFMSADYELADSVDFEGKKYFISDIYISDDIKCAVCSTEVIKPEMRVLE